MRHVSRTHRVALDWLIWQDPKSKSNLLTPRTNLPTSWQKGNFTREEWSHPLRLFSIMEISQFASSHFSSTSSSRTVSKRRMQQERPGEDERMVAKSKPMWNLVSKTVDRSPNSAGFECIVQPRDTGSKKTQIWISGSTGKLAARDSNENTASSSQAWHSET